MTYVLIHGGGDSAASWSLVERELRGRGQDVVAVDLPVEDDTAGWAAYVSAVVDAIGDRRDLVVVGHSLGGFTAPLVCDRVPVDLLVLVAAMVPAPQETVEEWWGATGYARAVRDLDEQVDHDDSELAVFFHDVPPDRVRLALAAERRQGDRAMQEPWPLDAWPDVPTRHLLCREDRMFPAPWLRGVVQDRLGITPDEIDGGHCPHLSRPEALADRLEAYRLEVRRAAV